MLFSKFSDFYTRFEKYISPVGLIYGFIFTSLTLTRVDKFLENFWVLVHLIIAACGIVVLTAYENKFERRIISDIDRPAADADRQKFHFYLTLIIQFAFGGLFSTFFVFYLRSSSLAESWLFLLFLVILLIGNELWKKHYKRLTFQITILFVSIYLFSIFLLPVIFHRLGPDLFIASGVLSLIMIFLFTKVLAHFAREKFYNSRSLLRWSIGLILVLSNVMYFTGIIPPIPLSMKDSGVYHGITKILDPASIDFGNYEAQAEPHKWQDFFNRYPVFHRQVGETVYAYSAIFSPVAFNTEIIHQWQYYDEIKKEWIDSNRVTLPIVGGRDGGFRTYSVKDAVPSGLWRVKVMTPQGQVIGNINFSVQEATTIPSLVTEIL